MTSKLVPGKKEEEYPVPTSVLRLNIRLSYIDRESDRIPTSVLRLYIRLSYIDRESDRIPTSVLRLDIRHIIHRPRVR